jgi:hypothetical protein
MNRIVEFYESNHLSVLIALVVLFGIYFFSIRKDRKKMNASIKEKDNDELSITDPNPPKTKEILINRTRFFINQLIYNELIRKPEYGLRINVNPKSGSHPKGFYLMGNNVAVEFINSKQGTHNWDINQNFHQDSIPVALREYFTPLPFRDNLNLNDLEKVLKVNPPKKINMTKDLKSNTLENFKTYLIQQGYSEYTPTGKNSTVYDYSKRVEKILERERISIQNLAENIDLYVRKYDADGNESEYGKKSHSAIINALKRFQDFCR